MSENTIQSCIRTLAPIYLLMQKKGALFVIHPKRSIIRFAASFVSSVSPKEERRK